ncbi:MAG: LysM peptidoglycan-binding domain-containing protein, partial [Oscillospiraceae bacterium]|nr:LysM peptidoglycan-binding domain-containing protein [Oscillospiraceae bacterium]
QVLYYDNAGNLQSGAARGEEIWQIPSDPQNKVDAYVQMSGWPVADVNEQGIALTALWDVTADVFSEQGLPMLTQITLGEKCEKDPGRPSLILRKAGNQRLWDIARECGSTVDAIVEANHLQDQPEAGQILLIPVS